MTSNTARARRKQSDPMHSNRSRGTLMSYFPSRWQIQAGGGDIWILHVTTSKLVVAYVFLHSSVCVSPAFSNNISVTTKHLQVRANKYRHILASRVRLRKSPYATNLIFMFRTAQNIGIANTYPFYFICYYTYCKWPMSPLRRMVVAAARDERQLIATRKLCWQ